MSICLHEKWENLVWNIWKMQNYIFVGILLTFPEFSESRLKISSLFTRSTDVFLRKITRSPDRRNFIPKIFFCVVLERNFLTFPYRSARSGRSAPMWWFNSEIQHAAFWDQNEWYNYFNIIFFFFFSWSPDLVSRFSFRRWLLRESFPSSGLKSLLC